MAKKETTAAATVASKAASKIAVDVLKANPDINEVHVTSDGTAFYTRNDARNHANTLKNREVYSHKRDSTAVRAKKADTPAAADTTDALAPEVDELTGEVVDDTSDTPDPETPDTDE